MYNLRYHIASLVGVFLALALGLVLGGLVVQRGTVDRQQGALVAGLRTEFVALRKENRTLAEQNRLLNSLSGDLTDAWAADRLVGKNVIVVSEAGRSDGLQSAIDAIRVAGGTPIVVAVNGQNLALGSDEVRSAVSSGTDYSSDLAASVAATLAAEWTQPLQERPLTQTLIDAGAITVEGFDPGMAAYALVDIAPLREKVDVASIALANSFIESKAGAVIAQAPASKSGAAAAAAERNIPSFDTLGTQEGRYTLVALLTGAKPGYYGTGESATAPYPPIPEK